MPRTEQQNQVLRAESRARIIAHALKLFASHGYEQTSVRMIAQAAGIAQGLMYNYFGSKDELLRAIFEQSIQDVRESFARAEAEGSADQRIERLLRASFAILQRQQDFWRLSYGLRGHPAVLERLGPEILAWAAEIRQRLEGYFRDIGVADAAIEASILFGLIDGIAQHFILDPENYPLGAVVERIVQRYAKH